MQTIFLISDQPVLIHGFEQILSGNGFEIAGKCIPSGVADSGIEAKQPRLILLDAAGGLAFTVLNELRARAPACSIVLWSDSVPLDLVFRTLEFGVRGLVERSSRPDQLIEALRRVADGELQIGFPVSAQGEATKRRASLTPREREIVTLLRRGMRNKQIADEMGITEGTVKIYLFRLFHKVGVRNRFELARYHVAEPFPQSAGIPKQRERPVMRPGIA